MDSRSAGRIGGRNRRRTHRAAVRIFKTVPMAMLLAFSAVASADDASPAGCRSDADCKLIYSSCSCVAVPVSDPRTFLPSNVECPVNVCRIEGISATCEEHVCQPDSRPKGTRQSTTENPQPTGPAD